ncbi:MAG: undecaprenyl-diphosphate phosphatase [Pseudomonadota bacterium]
MSYVHLLLLALVQGVTEFLPVSSSGHLILLPALLGIEDQGLALDVAVHVGTLFAVVVYFRRDVATAAMGVPALVTGRWTDPAARLAGLLVIATVPVVLAGALLKLTGAVDLLRSPATIGWATLVFGLILYWADRTGAEARAAADWTLRHAVIMGMWQALALIPGTSRSGITITGARLLGYTRTEGARLAMLMSIPTIAASGVLLGAGVVGRLDWPLLRDAGIAATMAFASALLALHLMFRLLEHVSFTPYVIYRVMLGVGLLIYAYA